MLKPCVILLLPFGCGWCLVVMALVYLGFIYNLLHNCCYVCVCLRFLNVCAARHAVLLWVRLSFMGLDQNYWLQPWSVFFLLASFGLWCHICYFVGCFQKFGWQLLVFDSLHCQRIFTMVCGSGLCSTSFPGGHQVDGLPPASSMANGFFNFEMLRMLPSDRNEGLE